MKIKTLSALILALSVFVFIACSDDLDSIGNTIQPAGDDIFVGSDTVSLLAATGTFKDSVYARSTTGLLGEYIDPTFGKIKSDFLCEFYYPEGAPAFMDEDKMVSIDSVFLINRFVNFEGDTVSPMGLSVYEIQKDLKPFFFTNVDPKNYLGDTPKLLGQSSFSIQGLRDTLHIKTIRTQLDRSLGVRFYQEWLTNEDTFKNSDTFKKFFKGIYVTSTFGSGSLMETFNTYMNIYFTYKLRKTDNSADSLAVAALSLSVTPEVIQLNHIKNSFPTFNVPGVDKNIKTYLKTPAGLYTELNIPLGEILNKANERGADVINAANLKLKGLTEDEDALKMNRPSYILLINKDSLPNFFFNNKLHDSKTSFLITRNQTNNTYDFGNVASIINHYANYYKSIGSEPKDLKYLMIPVSVEKMTGSDAVIGLYNTMYPTSAILRTDEANMKMPIIFSKYNNRK